MYERMIFPERIWIPITPTEYLTWMMLAWACITASLILFTMAGLMTWQLVRLTAKPARYKNELPYERDQLPAAGRNVV